MGGKSSHPRNQKCDGALFILGRRASTSGCGAADFFCPRFNHSVTWKHEADIVNNGGEKYTIGSAKNLETLDDEKYGEFLIFRDKVDLSEEHFRIESDANGTFWLHSLGGRETFLNGKLLEDSTELKFGNIFYFSPIFSPFWDSRLIPLAKKGRSQGLLYHKKWSGQEYAVFKFERLIRDATGKQIIQETGKNDINKLFLCHPIFYNHVILTTIFERLVNPSSSHTRYNEHLFTCRLVSKSWNDSVRLVIQKNLVPSVTIGMQELQVGTHYRTNRWIYWKTGGVSALKFDSLSFNIYGNQPHNYDPIDYLYLADAITKFNQDLSRFINQADSHPLNLLIMKIEYFTPICILLSRFSNPLVELNIQINKVWIYDGNHHKSGFPKDLRFPNLKKLTLEFFEHKEGDLANISDSSCLAQLIQASSRIEELVLKNYAKLPTEFGTSFKNLRKITIFGQWEYNVQSLNLHDFLAQVMPLSANQLTSFTLDLPEILVQQGTKRDELLSFLQKHRRSLEYLELSIRVQSCAHEPRPFIRVPRCMSNLKKVWISWNDHRGGSNSWWGFKLGSQLKGKEGEDFTAEEMSEGPFVVREGRNCGQESCRTCDDSLVYGEWRNKQLNKEMYPVLL
ncbi:uncharacterized protein LOC118438112 [Folsomia candida]|nr:uncharacterized protein LOC118438112 [Folsomia candida]